MGTHTLCTAWFAMITVTYLPPFVTSLFRGMPGIWQSRHRLILCWLVCLQALYPGQKTLAERARWTPAQVTVWRCRRLRKASDWNVHGLVEWWGQEALNTLPPPKDGTLYLVGDGSVKPKRGMQNPLAQKGRKSEHQPGFFGIRFALLIAHWDVYRLPGAFRLIRPKSHPEYRTENALFRERGGALSRPPGPSGLSWRAMPRMAPKRIGSWTSSAMRMSLPGAGALCWPWPGHGKRLRIKRSKTG